MQNLAPGIYRQRMIIEGIYTIDIKPSKLKTYMKGLSAKIGMTIVYGPIVKNLVEKINPSLIGYECILIWMESGAAVYTWSKEKFLQ